MPSEQLSLAISAIKSGDKATGSRLLAAILESEPSNEIAWIWLATSQDDIEKKIFCLKKALSLNPNNYTYVQALIKLELQSQPYLEEIPPPHLPQKTSTENTLVAEEEKSVIPAPLAKPVLLPVRSSHPVHHSSRKLSIDWEELGKYIFALLMTLFFVMCILALIVPDLFLNFFEN